MSDRPFHFSRDSAPAEPMPMDEESIDEVSKTERKREAHAARDLGERLAELTPMQLTDFPLSDALRVALRETSGIRAHGARKRHFQYIGKLMRHHDVAEIERQLALVDPDAPHNVRLMHEGEHWRARLLDEGSDALTDFVAANPHTDVQALRQLLRQVAKERAEQNPPRYYRALYRFIRDVLALASPND